MLRNYKDIIRAEVKKVNAEDTNWNWSVKSIKDDLVSIRWGYLDYLQEENNCFFIRLEDIQEDNEMYLRAETPDGQIIEGFLVTTEVKEFWQDTYEHAIIKAIRSIANAAHSRW